MDFDKALTYIESAEYAMSQAQLIVEEMQLAYEELLTEQALKNSK